MTDLSKQANLMVNLKANEIVLTDAERQPCEVWTRVMGYHRPVASFNIGKKGEHGERKFFQECSTQLAA